MRNAGNVRRASERRMKRGSKGRPRTRGGKGKNAESEINKVYVGNAGIVRVRRELARTSCSRLVYEYDMFIACRLCAQRRRDNGMDYLHTVKKSKSSYAVSIPQSNQVYDRQIHIRSAQQ